MSEGSINVPLPLVKCHTSYCSNVLRYVGTCFVRIGTVVVTMAVVIVTVVEVVVAGSCSCSCCYGGNVFDAVVAVAQNGFIVVAVVVTLSVAALFPFLCRR